MRKNRFGRTGLQVSAIGFGGFPMTAVNRARAWNGPAPEGRRTAIATMHRALDLGINFFDTAPHYGDGYSETLIGEVMRTRRAECVLATKISWEHMDPEGVAKSVEGSLARLQTDYVDIVQVHGVIFTAADCAAILGGPLEGLRRLRDQGKLRYTGVTTEEPHSCLPLMESNAFDVVQLNYNIMYQAAALHALKTAGALDLGVVTMRTLTSGIFPRLIATLAPEWQQAKDVNRVCLEFILSDSRIHVANIGMRWPEEVDQNVQLVDNFAPPLDVANLPRLTTAVYEAEDATVAASPRT